MNHSDAINSKAAERYLLGELDPRVREEFEEHFFGCVECARDVRAGAVFVDAAKDILSSESPAAAPVRAPQTQKPSWWALFLRPAFALPAVAFLLPFFVYQNAYMIPRMRSQLSRANAPETLPSFSLLGANSRGGTAVDIVTPRAKPLALFVDIPPGQEFSSYACDVQDASGSIAFSVNVSPEEAKRTVTLLVPPSRLNAGNYVLVVRGYGSSQQGGAAAEVARYPFSLKYSD